MTTAIRVGAVRSRGMATLDSGWRLLSGQRLFPGQGDVLALFVY